MKTLPSQTSFAAVKYFTLSDFAFAFAFALCEFFLTHFVRFVGR